MLPMPGEKFVSAVRLIKFICGEDKKNMSLSYEIYVSLLI